MQTKMEKRAAWRPDAQWTSWRKRWRGPFVSTFVVVVRVTGHVVDSEGYWQQFDRRGVLRDDDDKIVTFATRAEAHTAIRERRAAHPCANDTSYSVMPFGSSMYRGLNA